MTGIRLRINGLVVRRLRGLLVRYVRARPRPADEEGAERRVTFLLNAAWGMGGTIRTTLNLAGWLASQGYEVEILSVGRGRDLPFFGEFPPGVRVTALDDKRDGAARGRVERLLRGRTSLFMHPADLAADAFNMWVDVRLVRALRRRTGFLISTRPGLNFVAADLRPPGLTLVGQEHMHLREHREALKKAMKRRYRKLDVLTVLTERDRQAYERHLRNKVPVVRVPNSARDLGPGKADLSAKTVISAGRLSPQKGFDLLIRAFAIVAPEHPDWRLVIYGDGPKRELLEGIVDEYGVAGSVALPGPSDDLGGEMERASIFALSSRWEGLPLVLLEAMSKGMAVVSFDCPTGPRDVIEDRVNGLLLPPKRIKVLAAALEELIESEELRRTLAAGAVETAEGYTLDAVGAQWEALLREVRG